MGVDELAATAVLPRWDYADAFECPWQQDEAPDAMGVARALLAPSRTATRVLGVRDRLVTPLGLRPAHQGHDLLFPVQVAEPNQVVCGLDDRHLDFRVLITVSSGAARCTTVVRRHGALGAAYFGVVAPFHRLVVQRMLQRAQQRAAGEGA